MSFKIYLTNYGERMTNIIQAEKDIPDTSNRGITKGVMEEI